MKNILAMVLAGLSVGLGNFAASIAIGLSGASRTVRLRLALVFGLFETGMPIVGLLLGHKVADKFGSHASVIGGALLILTGIYITFGAVRTVDREVKSAEAKHSWGKMLLAGLALSIDNLVVGFGLGAHHQNIAEAAVIIGVTSIILAILGLEIGGRASSKLEGYSEVASGLILVLVGLAIALGVLG